MNNRLFSIVLFALLVAPFGFLGRFDPLNYIFLTTPHSISLIVLHFWKPKGSRWFTILCMGIWDLYILWFYWSAVWGRDPRDVGLVWLVYPIGALVLAIPMAIAKQIVVKSGRK